MTALQSKELHFGEKGVLGEFYLSLTSFYWIPGPCSAACSFQLKLLPPKNLSNHNCINSLISSKIEFKHFLFCFLIMVFNFSFVKNYQLPKKNLVRKIVKYLLIQKIFFLSDGWVMLTAHKYLTEAQVLWEIQFEQWEISVSHN